jgi:DNA helicase II / ATP-dependent DNA helicase PcrA
MSFPASIRSRSCESKAPEPPGADPRDRDPGRHAEGMNPQQAAAVLHDHEREGPALVLAGAGSGKTTVLARRIARQALLDGDGSALLALTFTKEAAGEMAARVRALLAASGAEVGAPRFGTFHAFAYGLVRETAAGRPNWDRLGFSRCPTLLDPEALAAWLPSGASVCGIQAPPDALERMVAAPFSGDGEAAGPAGELRERYRGFLRESGALAFDDMVALAIRLLRDHPDALAAARTRVRRILVDEFQDTSPDQLDLVSLLLGDGRSLFLVGDDDQAIYGFRGADPRNIDRAQRLFPGLRILKLEVNYRSTAPIVAYANRVFRDKPARLRKSLRAGRAPPEGAGKGAAAAPVRAVVHATGADEARWMAAEMRRLVREEGLGWGDLAVLYRLNALEPYYRSLLARTAGPESAAVTLATVHASKGLQYPAVFLVGLEDGVLPYRRPGGPADPLRLAEERRIFYVGVTRAERHLYLCACRSRMSRGRARALRPSPFLGLGLLRRLFGAEGRAFPC